MEPNQNGRQFFNGSNSQYTAGAIWYSFCKGIGVDLNKNLAQRLPQWTGASGRLLPTYITALKCARHAIVWRVLALDPGCVLVSTLVGCCRNAGLSHHVGPVEVCFPDATIIPSHQLTWKYKDLFQEESSLSAGVCALPC